MVCDFDYHINRTVILFRNKKVDANCVRCWICVWWLCWWRFRFL